MAPDWVSDVSRCATLDIPTTESTNMLDHLGINCADLDASARFYDSVLGVLGYRRVAEIDLPQVDGIHIGYGGDKPSFWISGGVLDGPNP